MFLFTYQDDFVIHIGDTPPSSAASQHECTESDTETESIPTDGSDSDDDLEAGVSI